MGVVRLGQKWRISIQFGVCYSATELHIYWAKSNETFCNERIYIVVVHLGIGSVVRKAFKWNSRVCFVISQGTRSCDLKCHCTDWDVAGSVKLTLLVLSGWEPEFAFSSTLFSMFFFSKSFPLNQNRLNQVSIRVTVSLSIYNLNIRLGY